MEGERIEALISTVRLENREDHREMSGSLAKLTTNLALVCKRVEDLEAWRNSHVVKHEQAQDDHEESWTRRWGYAVALCIAVLAAVLPHIL